MKIETPKSLQLILLAAKMLKIFRPKMYEKVQGLVAMAEEYYYLVMLFQSGDIGAGRMANDLAGEFNSTKLRLMKSLPMLEVDSTK